MRNVGSGSQNTNLFDLEESEEGTVLADDVRRKEPTGKKDYIIDEQFKQIIPPLQPHEYQFLEEGIKLHGVLEPITVWKEENTIVDGHNRYEISQRLGKKCSSKKISFSDRSEALLWIQKHQLERRNITDYTKYELIQGIKEKLQEIGKEKRKRTPTLIESILTENDKTDTDPHNTRKKIAGLLGWGDGKVGYADILYNNATIEVKTALRNGSVTINKAYLSIKNSLDDEQKEETKSGEYSVIYIDNPADTSITDTLKHIPIKDSAAENAMLFIWCPAVALDRLIRKLPSWGFHYRTMFVWEETEENSLDTDGINSIQHELLIVAEKGHVDIENPCERSSILSAKRIKNNRSVKIMKMIETMFPSQKKALVGEIRRNGWKNIGLNTSPVPEVISVPASLIEVGENEFVEDNNFKITSSPEFSKKGLADWSFNIGVACKFRCTYCYVPSLTASRCKTKHARDRLKEKGISDVRNAFSIYRGEENIKQYLELSFQKYKNKFKEGQVLFLCTLTDPLPDEKYLKITEYIIKETLRSTPLTVRLLTKSALVIDLAKALEDYKERVIYGISTGTTRKDISRILEERAAPIEERVKAIHWLQDNNYRTFGMICPVGVYESDEESVKKLLDNVRPEHKCCEAVWVEPINARAGNFKAIVSKFTENGLNTEVELMEQTREDKDRSAWFEYSKSLFNNFKAEMMRRGVLDKLNFLQYYHKGEESHFKKEDSKWIRFLKMDKSDGKKKVQRETI